MSKKTYRIDKTCLNCNYVVENKFCPNCGQENTDTRKTFHHLFIHFFEDLTHYENAFWRTIKNLLFKPASLTTEYLSGKRLSYLAPVRLYIFISFVTFLVLAILPDGIEELNVENGNDSTKTTTNKTETNIVKIELNEDEDEDSLSEQEIKLKQLFNDKKLTQKEFDTLVSYTKESLKKNGTFYFNKREYKSLQELDSLQSIDSLKLGKLEYMIGRKLMKVTKDKTPKEIITGFAESFKRNIPKALFVIMPIFAFFLWLFHNKKKWYYFDHGIFTLHYFSFVLLVILVSSLLVAFVNLFGKNSVTESIENNIDLSLFIWFIIYFFKANKNFYQETKLTSFVKSLILVFINFIVLSIVLVAFIIYSFITIH